MKKILLLLFGIFLLCGCGTANKEDVMNDLIKKTNKIKSYKITGNMEISNDEETFTYSIESYYLKDDFYKVILVNQTNNHEQIILKNNEDIYVITPTLNKSFKFQSEWPDNSSQAYLIGSVVKDIDDDKEAEIQEKNKRYIIKSKVNYPNNEDLKYQKVYLNNNKEIEKVEIYNENDILKIKVVFDDINLKANLNKKDFNLKDYIKKENEDKTNLSQENNDGENNNEEINNETSCEKDTATNECNNNSESSKEEINQETANIENIIYPLYIPSNTYLANSETINLGNANRVILTFSGDKNFVLIEEVSKINNDMEIIPVYGEPFMLSETIGALSANSLSWDVNNISYYLASTELSVYEMQSIANSLGNTSLVSNTK